jgi:accessory gene regulator protein AgrB
LVLVASVLTSTLLQFVWHITSGFAVWELEFRLPVTAAWLCFIVEVKNFCLALFVKLNIDANRITKVDAYSVKPKLQQT